MKLLDDLQQMRATLAAQGDAQAFIATEGSIHQLRSFVEENPASAVFFMAHFHDVLPEYSRRENAQAIVPSEQHRRLAVASGARAESIRVLVQPSASVAVSKAEIKNVVVLAEAHPYGGLVSALALLEQCRLLGFQWKIFEHSIASKEMFVPLRQAELHAFPRRPSECTFAWREHLQVRPASPQLDWGDDTLFLWMPLHLAPPLSLHVARLQQHGARLATIQTPWCDENECTLTFSGHHWKLFDPLRLPGESTVNAGIARGCAQLLLERWGNK